MESIYKILFFFLSGNSNFVENYYENYMNDVFPSVLIFNILISLIVAAIFYIVLNRINAKFNGIKHWLIFLAFNIIISFVIAYSTVKSNIDSFESDIWLFAVNNLLLSAIFYYLFSLALKNFSNYARKIPH